MFLLCHLRYFLGKIWLFLKKDKNQFQAYCMVYLIFTYIITLYPKKIANPKTTTLLTIVPIFAGEGIPWSVSTILLLGNADWLSVAIQAVCFIFKTKSLSCFIRQDHPFFKHNLRQRELKDDWNIHSRKGKKEYIKKWNWTLRIYNW